MPSHSCRLSLHVRSMYAGGSAMKPVLFVDVDGTVADSMSHWVACYNADRGTRFTVDDIKEYHLSQTFEDWEVFEDYYRNYRGVLPVEGSLAAIEELRENFRIVFVTAGYGEEWVTSWFNVRREDFMTNCDRSLLRGFGLVDDNPANLDVFIGQRFLISQPWNRGRGLNETTWTAIVQHLTEKINQWR